MVYRLVSPTYITTAEFSLSGNSEFFFLKDGEDLETFHHEGKQPAASYSIILSEEQLRTMVDRINSAIQLDNKIRFDSSNPKAQQSNHFHLVASESDAGSLRAALDRSDTVIPIPGYFAFGPLWALLKKEGQAYRNEWLYDHINLEMEVDEYAQRFINSLRRIKDIPTSVKIYIWYGHNAEEQTMLRFLINLLKEYNNDIILIDTNINGHLSTGQLSLSDMQTLFSTQHNNEPVNSKEQLRLQREWHKLSESKAVLRVWQDGVLIDSPDDIYDHLLIEAIRTLQNEQETSDFIQVTDVVFHVFFNADTFINTLFLEYRIRYLIYTGILAVKGVPKSMRHYRVKLR